MKNRKKRCLKYLSPPQKKIKLKVHYLYDFVVCMRESYTEETVQDALIIGPDYVAGMSDRTAPS